MEVLDTSIANIALPHIAGTFRREHERIHVGAHQLSGFKRHRAADQRVAGDAIRAQALLHVLRGAVCRQQFSVRAGADARHAGAFSGFCRESAEAACSRASKPSWRTPFTPAKRGMAFSIYGMAVVVAPAIGPTLGGWITDNYSWRWIFYINVPISIISLYMTHRFVEDPPYLREEQAKRKEA